MRSTRQYVLVLSSCLLAALVVSVILNTTVNPWRVTPAPWSVSVLDPYRDFHRQIRTGKAGLIRATPDIGVGLFGSSRSANGLDPDPELWGRSDVYNFGFSGGFIYENAAICRYLIERHHPDLIIFGVDPGDLNTDIDTRIATDFSSSPLDERQDGIDRELRYLFGISTAEASVATLQRAITKQRPKFTARGFRFRPEHSQKRSQLEFIRGHILGDAEFDLPDTSRADATIRPEKIELLKELMISCRGRGIKFVVFFQPSHALLHAELGDTAAPPVLHASEREAILHVVEEVGSPKLSGPVPEFWDFNGHHPFDCDPIPQSDSERMEHWNDLGHYTVEVGRVILSRIMGWSPSIQAGSTYGTKVTSENVALHFSNLRKNYQDYLTGPHRKDVEWKEELLHSGSRSAAHR